MNFQRPLLVDTTQYLPTSPLFAEALRELATERDIAWVFVDEAPFFGRHEGSLFGRGLYRLRRRPPGFRSFNRHLVERARSFKPDVVVVVKGSHVAPETLEQIRRETGAVLINYATDDPFNPRNSTPDLVSAIGAYDIYASTKMAILDDLLRAGARRVEYVRFAYKPDVHFPEEPTSAEERARFDADVCFIGGCDADRIPFFEALAKAVPNARLALYGGYWDRVPTLKSRWKGFVRGRDFRLAVGGARIMVNLVRRANRDDHCMRTFELPACRGFVLGDRTPGHEALFRDGEDLILFDEPDDLVDKVRELLPLAEERAAMARSGWARVTRRGDTYRDRLVELFALAGSNS